MIEFEAYLRRYCMPTRTLDNGSYKIVEVNDNDTETM